MVDTDPPLGHGGVMAATPSTSGPGRGTFAPLHRPGDPFVLPNAWDVGTARALAAAGFPAVGTTSLGVAASHGLVDGAREDREQTRRLVAALLDADLGVPLTVDVADGWSDDPGEVADVVAGLGVDGVNLEDSTRGVLVDPAVHEARIRAVVAQAPPVFVNARCDVLWLGGDDVTEAVVRLRRYVDAGAHGVFLPGAADPSTVARVVHEVPAPLNVLASPTLTLADLAALGVSRVSTGSLPYRAALHAAVSAAIAVRDGSALPGALPYDEVQKLHAR